MGQQRPWSGAFPVGTAAATISRRESESVLRVTRKTEYFRAHGESAGWRAVLIGTAWAPNSNHDNSHVSSTDCGPGALQAGCCITRLNPQPCGANATTLQTNTPVTGSEAMLKVMWTLSAKAAVDPGSRPPELVRSCCTDLCQLSVTSHLSLSFPQGPEGKPGKQGEKGRTGAKVRSPHSSCHDPPVFLPSPTLPPEAWWQPVSPPTAGCQGLPRTAGRDGSPRRPRAPWHPRP